MALRKRRKVVNALSPPSSVRPSCGSDESSVRSLSLASTRLTSTSHPSCLPADILLLIVEAIGKNEDPQNELRACALTCRLLRSRSQARLFSSPILSDEHQYSTFSRALDGSSALSAYVQSLRLYVGTTHPDMPIPPHLVVGLKNLKAATFVGDGTVLGTPVPERTISFVKLFGVLSSTLSRLELVLFKFADFAELVRLIWSFPDITSLSLVGCSWGKSHEQNTQRDCLPEIQHYPRRAQCLTSLTVSLPLSLRFSLTSRGSCDSHLV
ncbi:hypothetical protein BD309DRAFT_257987 [Dichomitus squalens]|uniref:F-box domain-containing protein n=1 Tax=Dichomitus squalens (strain LYAD-421) TaxID=732165 RepID=R7SMU5_DICSQ|nr:uncharacterized protein DICSQDRAFT_140717 [Dichomitus squalens LYAD-421 SS1]EJF57045.1 hypothetical protein DICSQDRAFT_140717 [Dichomitus squalens LYAD-421 SS1]TBU41631.1 hypothetical protein BD309DRAFT_257987 [Dichomitus squalens]